MPDYVVDLDMCVAEPDAWDEQIIVAVSAPSRAWAANLALTRAYEEYDAYQVRSCAVGAFDGTHDHDWRDKRLVKG